ncbi:uncharacterized protein LOC143000308 [Genypterus blacodes]|uniref:uncharacterized protein LOC143000308 n=1 Tax=Genypterus blacodes TaxID=154954 RepID=UPI003F76877F
MAPQLYISMYTEQFGSLAGGERARLRPTSAHRRNNPHPRPDFLFPRTLLRPVHAMTRSPPRPWPPADTGPPLLPPVRPSSLPSLNTACPDRPVSTWDTLRHTQQLPSSLHALPSAGSRHKLQLTLPDSDLSRDLQSEMDLVKGRQMDPQRNVGRLTHTQGLRRLPGAHLLTRPHTDQQLRPPHSWRSRCSLSASSKSGYACFHVVKPYQEGHYVIHPEFVSESLR